MEETIVQRTKVHLPFFPWVPIFPVEKIAGTSADGVLTLTFVVEDTSTVVEDVSVLEEIDRHVVLPKFVVMVLTVQVVLVDQQQDIWH